MLASGTGQTGSTFASPAYDRPADDNAATDCAAGANDDGDCDAHAGSAKTANAAGIVKAFMARSFDHPRLRARLRCSAGR
jgi:hypothetical protein